MGERMVATPREMMTICAARELRDGELVFVGTGLPLVCTMLAQRYHTPNIVTIYEAGVIDAYPKELPISVGDPCLARYAMRICSMPEIFGLLQSGRIDVGFLGGAQIDRFGNINSTVIGPYNDPIARLAGSGGAHDIGCLAKRTLIVVEHEKRRFVEKVDYITVPGYLTGYDARERTGLKGGPSAVVTTFGVFRFHPTTREMYLESYYPGVTVSQILDNTGWALQILEEVHETEPPTDEELSILRMIDPEGLFISR